MMGDNLKTKVLKLICKAKGHDYFFYPVYNMMFDPPEKAWACDRCGEDFGTDGPTGEDLQTWLFMIKNFFRRD